VAHLQGVEENSLTGAIVTLERIAIPCHTPLNVIQMMIKHQYKTDHDFHRRTAWYVQKGRRRPQAARPADQTDYLLNGRKEEKEKEKEDEEEEKEEEEEDEEEVKKKKKRNYITAVKGPLYSCGHTQKNPHSAQPL
jgi:cell division ATPase FtsA